MAAKRKKLLPARTVVLLLLAGLCALDCLTLSKGDVLLNKNDKHVERIKRDGDVTVLLLDDTGKKKTSPTPVGLLSSMARTFVQDGVTTEYATHVIGTTVGDRYAHIVSTGSRVFYDNVKPTNRHDAPAAIDLQTLLLSDDDDDSTERPQVPEKTKAMEKKEETNFVKSRKLEKPIATTTAPETVDDRRSSADVSVRREVSSSSSSSSMRKLLDPVRPAKVNEGLATFTVNSNDDNGGGYYLPLPLTERQPSGKRDDDGDNDDYAPLRNKSRSSKNLFRNGLKPVEIRKYETVTYYGFADFMTTVGNTVIVFMPRTPVAAAAAAVTSIRGEPTLRPEHVISPSRSAPMATETAAYSAGQRAGGSAAIEPSPATTFDGGAGAPVAPTEPLSSRRRISETTRVFNNEREALGLLKTIGAVDAIDAKTTRLTTFYYGTYVDGKYTQLEQTVSSLLLPSTKPAQPAKPLTKKSETTKMPTPPPLLTTTTTTTTTESPAAAVAAAAAAARPPLAPPVTAETTTDVTEPDTTTEAERQEIVSPAPSSPTPYKTYTYLTTFFIPVNETATTTSVKSRIVLSPETNIAATAAATAAATTAASVTSTTAETATSPMAVANTTESAFTTTPGGDDNDDDDDDDGDDDDDQRLYSTTTSSNEEEEEDDMMMVTTEKEIPRSTGAAPAKEELAEDKNTNGSDETTTAEIAMAATTPVEDDEEVELLFKTLYTTYTYLTTFFRESTPTSVSSRELVVTNIVTSTVEDGFLATDPAVAGLFDREEGSLLNAAAVVATTAARSPRVFSTPVSPATPPPSAAAETPKPVDDDLFASTVESVDYAGELATPPLDDGLAKTFSETSTLAAAVSADKMPTTHAAQVYMNAVSMPSDDVPMIEPAGSSEHAQDMVASADRMDDSVVNGRVGGPKEMNLNGKNDGPKITPVHKYDMTITRNRTNYNVVMDNDHDDDKSTDDDIVVSGGKSSSSSSSTVTKSILTNTIKRKVSTDDDADDGDDSGGVDDDMDSSETVNERVESSPTHQLETSFTTYTYFTTIYKGSSSSQVVSRFETVTNVVPHTIEPTSVTDDGNSDETGTIPVTFFTTYTYWTTLYKDGTTVVTSREDTLTNVAPSSSSSPPPLSVSPSVADKIEITPTRLQPSDTAALQPSATVEKSAEPEPTTFFTTFTYFTTSYLDNATIVNSRLETVTNVLSDKTAEPVENENDDKDSDSDEESVIKTTPSKPLTEQLPMPVLRPTGLLSSITSDQVEDGKTTSFTTDVYGTYIDGLYAQILESRSNVVGNVSPTELKPNGGKSTGIVALNEGKIVDADGVSTTFYTTKALGTYIDQLYAQVIESTSSIKVNEKQRTSDPATTVLAGKTYRTGLVSLIEGTSVKDFDTTYYETKAFGKIVDGKYTQEFESDSTVKSSVRPTAAVQEIKASSTQLNEILQSRTPISPSPATIESSLGDSGSTTEKSEETDDDNSSKKKTFPVIRPFASRARPTFQPKKKSTDSLATINRSITPTIVATPALKTNDRGSVPVSRNRFSGVRKPSASLPVSEITPSSSSSSLPSNSRKYSRSKVPNTPIVSSSVYFKNRTGSSSAAPKIAPTSSAPSFGGSRRSTSSQRLQSSKLPDVTVNKSATPSRFRIRPTVSSNFNRFSNMATATTSTTTTTTEEVSDENDVNTSLVATDESALSQSNDGQDESSTGPTTTTTTESSRRGNNPLLKLRRPPLPKTPITTPSSRKSTGRTTTARTTTSTTTTTIRPQRPKTPSPLITRNRPKPVNGLFPNRGFGKKEQEQEVTNEPTVSEEEKPVQDANPDDVAVDDNGFDGAVAQIEPQSNAVSETERPSRGSRTFANNQVQIRPFNGRLRTNSGSGGRSKRQAVEFGNRNDNGRSYRNRQPAKNTNVDYVYYDEYVEYDAPAPVKTVPPPPPPSPPPRRSPSRSRPQQQQQQKVQPTAVSSSNFGRSQFTLREKPAAAVTTPTTPTRTSNYRRTRPPPVAQETTTASKRLSRLRYPTTTATPVEPLRNNRRYTPSARRQSPRTRYRDDPVVNSPSVFDGSITVTHKIPTELTIPVVIGKNTEYKQVLTAKPSIEVLGPHQYSTVAGKNGAPTVQLTREVTELLPGGATEITKFVLYEQATSSVTFTPTYIRGRKTSYSHVVPSTVYEVRPEVSTVQPQQLANAPLANLLLSQLLLGNLAVQPTVNPLLALNSPTVQSPVTELKTRSTTYVTTVTHSASTVLPITFRGKVISTTVVDSSSDVITATEYITETIVTTPTVQQQNNNQQQLNTLLLPALLQAQLLGGQGVTANNAATVNAESGDATIADETVKPPRKKAGSKKPPDPEAIQPAEATVVTLYVSGKRPGEFSTVLSTVGQDLETATVRKRQVEPSASVIGYSGTTTGFEDALLSSAAAIDDEPIATYNEEETQSLESVLGDVSENVKIENSATNVNVMFVEPQPSSGRPTAVRQTTTGHFLSKGSADAPVQREVVNSQIWSLKRRTKRRASDRSPTAVKGMFPFGFPKIPEKHLTQNVLYNVGGDRENSSFTVSKNLQDYKPDSKADEQQRAFDERRLNFATKKMSNGVEVIVAGDKSTYPGQASVLRVLPTSQAKPITLAPSTLTDHMLMMLPHPIKQSMNNQFVTKTYLTTYTYLTTFLDGDATVVSSREKVVSNVVTDEPNKITPTSTLSQVTLTASPSLETGVYHTTYTYLNTIVDGDVPLVMTSQKTVANTVTAPHEFLTPLQPSEPAYHNTNTYLNTVSFTKTLSDGPDYTVVSTEDILTQVIITRTDNTPTMDSSKFKEENIMTDVTKTYYVTYTYYNTIQDRDSTVVKSDISVSSDVVTEKHIPVPTRTDEIIPTPTAANKLPFNLYATKTYLTTFTYFTTLLKDNEGKNPSSTQVKSRSKIVQNIVTESLNTSMFNSNYLSSLSSSLQNEKVPITATATLENGQRIEFTAMNDVLPIEQNEPNPIQSVQTEETPNPVAIENNNKPTEKPKETIKPSSVNKVSQKTEIQKPPKKNSPSKSEQKVPVSSVPSVKPDNSNVGGMIDFGKIGSSLTALKPVISAVAGIIQNNLKNEQKTKNVLMSQKSTPKPIKQETSSRAPIYIPVGGLADSVGSESQQYPDTDQRHPHVGPARPPVEASLLSGGIPISPGEVITTNSDVIIGKPSVLGPRPPTENSNQEETPFGMRPPPPPQFKDKISLPNNVAREHIKNNLPHTDRKNTQPVRYHENRVQAQYQLTNAPVKSEVNIIPLSKPDPWPTKFVTDIQPLVLTNPDIQPQVSYGNQHLITSNQPSFLEHSSVDPLLVNIQPSQVAQVVIPHGSQTALIYSDRPATKGHGSKGEIFNDPQPYPENQVNPGFVGLEVYGTINPTNNIASKIPANAMHFDIPISPAGITVGDSESHHVVLFDNETGEVKTKPVQISKPPNPNKLYLVPQNPDNPYSTQQNPDNQYLTPHNPNIQYPTPKNPSSQYPMSQNPNIQYPTPQNPNNQYPIQQMPNNQHSVQQNFHNQFPTQQNPNNQYPTPQNPHNQHPIPHGSNNKYLTPQKPNNNQYPTAQNPNNQHSTAPPPISQINSFVRRPEASLSVEDDLLQFEDGEVTQESKKTPLRPGELPFGTHNNESDEDKTPIITGKPVVSGFNGGEEQILSIGTPIGNKKPTELKPGNFIVPNQNRPDLKYNIQHSNNEQTANGTAQHNTLVINVPSAAGDDIQHAMDMDEKLPPLPAIKHEADDLDGQGSTPQPSVVKTANHGNEVLGLSPPPMITHSPKYDNVTQRPAGSRRPVRPKPKPSTTPPPYQFERPLNRRPVKPPYNDRENVLTLKPVTSTAKIEPVQKWEASMNSRPPVYRPPAFKEDGVPPEVVKPVSKVATSQGSTAKSKWPEKTEDGIAVVYGGDRPAAGVTPTAVVVAQDVDKWHEYGPISSTESRIETAESATTETPALSSSSPAVDVIKSYTTPSKPAGKTTTDYYRSVISVVVKNDEKPDDVGASGSPIEPSHTTPKQQQSAPVRPQVTILQLPERPSFMDEFHEQLHRGSSLLPTRFVTHTQTMSVTVTETTVLQSDGFEPSTHTLVLTKTQTSTLVDTVTEIHTLVRPTQVLSTVTTTVPVHRLAPAVEGVKTKTVNGSPAPLPPPDENDTLLVVMTDKKSGNHGTPPQPPPPPPEIQVPDETNEIGPSDVLLSGILTHSSDTECRPECKASKNEICQRVENAMRCVCRPGFARIFMDRPCKPTYTYTMKLVLDKFGREPIKWRSSQLDDPGSSQYRKLTEATREGLNRMSMQSDLRDVYHGVIVGGFERADSGGDKAVVSYIIQLSENADHTKLWEATKKSLRATNYSLGGTDVFAARDQLQSFSAEDFDECSDTKFHDCSDNAKCTNLHGTYTCSCKDGFTDLSLNNQFPGRICSSELIACDLCNYHGSCYLSNQEQTVCECFQWYAGKHCQFNLKVLLLALIAIGVILLSLLVACLLMACCKKRSRGGASAMRGGMYPPQRPVIGFRRYRNMIATTRGDKRAMISVDTGSETSVDRTPPPYVKQVMVNPQQRPPVHMQQHGHGHGPMKTPSPSSHGGSTMRGGLEQRDRSLTVMIPRAKYRHVSAQQSPPSVLTMSTFSPEQKAVSYMDSRQTPTKESRRNSSSRKPSDSTQRSDEIQPVQRKNHAAPQRRPSAGALVSAGFEVSATVVKTKELDEAYVCHDDDKPDFNTGRTTAARTVSVARSFDETTIQPPTRCYHPESHYESKSQYSHKTNDEGHTMVERDLGSTYLMPQSKLYKPDNRGSDTSNFDSL